MLQPKSFVRLTEPPCPRISLRRAATVFAIPPLVVLFVLLSCKTAREPSFATPPPSPTIKALLDHVSPANTSFKQLVALSDSQRADALAHALDSWKLGPLPAAVSVTAAVCTPRDAADAIVRGDLTHVTVLDIGAHSGHPVTTIALQRAARLVFSIDPRTFGKLAALSISGGRLFVPIIAVSVKPIAVTSSSYTPHETVSPASTVLINCTFVSQSNKSMCLQWTRFYWSCRHDGNSCVLPLSLDTTLSINFLALTPRH